MLIFLLLPLVISYLRLLELGPQIVLSENPIHVLALQVPDELVLGHP